MQNDIRYQQEDAGTLLFWKLPETAFARTEDELHSPSYKVIHGDTIIVSFVDWMRQTA